MKHCRAPEPLHHHWPCFVRWRLVLYYTLSAHLSTLFLKKAYSFFKLFQICPKPAWREQKKALHPKMQRLSWQNGGQGWIRTIVIRRWQIYSLFPLTTRAPTHLVTQEGLEPPTPWFVVKYSNPAELLSHIIAHIYQSKSGGPTRTRT